MIRSFGDKETARFFYSGRSRKFASIQSSLKRKLQLLESAKELQDLASPGGNHLEALGGDRKGQHGIKVNDQYRICFHWEGEPEDVEVVDYH